jgi:ribosomal protein S21
MFVNTFRQKTALCEKNLQNIDAYDSMLPMTMIVIEVEKNQNENTVNLLRRFTKKMHGAKILNTVRGQKYTTRPESKLRKKRRVLKNLETTKKMDRLKKLGKIAVKS